MASGERGFGESAEVQAGLGDARPGPLGRVRGAWGVVFHAAAGSERCQPAARITGTTRTNGGTVIRPPLGGL
jgi:hypothetical protein